MLGLGGTKVRDLTPGGDLGNKRIVLHDDILTNRSEIDERALCEVDKVDTPLAHIVDNVSLSDDGAALLGQMAHLLIRLELAFTHLPPTIPPTS